jgi:hypothetical protein
MPSWKVIATVVVFTVLGFLLSPQAPLGAAIWGAPPAGGEDPTGAQIGLLMFVALVESIAFGLGVAFLVFAFPALVRALDPGAPARIAHLAIAWGLVSWVPHSALHQTNGDNMARLIVIEYAFHVTLIVAAAALAWVLLRARDAKRVSPGAKSPA